MKALSCNKPGQFNYIDLPLPAEEEGMAVIRIRRIGICGTDIHAYDGTQPFFNYPRVLGHELSGELQSAHIAGFQPGERVTFIPYYHCGVCIACRAGKTNCCVKMQVCGVHVDGGMVEFLSVPQDSLLHGFGFNLDELALVEPHAIGAHAVRRAVIGPGEWVLVIGAGPIGLATMRIASLAGANVIAMDMQEDRLEFASTKFGMVHTINPKTTAVIETLRELTDGAMPTIVMDATGNLKAIEIAFQYLAHTGRYILVGLQKENISFSHPEFHKREATLMSSRNATREDFEYVMGLIQRKSIDPTLMVTHRTKFSQLADDFKSWIVPGSGLIKGLVEIN